MISNQNTLVAKQNETQSEELSDGNRNNTRKLQVRRDREPSRSPWKRILNLFNKSKAIWRYVRSHIMRSVPHSSALKTISSFN